MKSLPYLVFLFSAVTLFSQPRMIERHPDLDRYLALNGSEERLLEYADDEGMLNLKLHQLDRINENRGRYKAPPVELDILACRVGNRMALEGAEQGFMGHWNTRGEKPYHRYSFAGGVDHVSENAAACSSSGPLSLTQRALLDYMGEALESFMAEEQPNDGHKLNVIDPVHTHVGLGLAGRGGEYRYYEEYIDRYLEFEDPPFQAAVGEEARLKLRVLEPGRHFFVVMACYEPFPSPLTPGQINRRGGYRDFTETEAFSYWPWELKPYVSKTNGALDLPLAFAKPGLYYIQVYLSDREFTGGQASTEGKIQASGLVVRVR